MTTIDEQLRTALSDAADTIAPPDGARAILAAASEALDEQADTAVFARVRGHLTSTPKRIAAIAAVVIALAVLLTSLGIAFRPTAYSPRVTAFHTTNGVASPTSPALGVTFGDSNGSLQTAGASQTWSSEKSVQLSQKTATRGTTLASKVVATGTIGLSVPNNQINSAVNHLSTIALSEGGFVASSRVINGTNGAPARGSITLRVPQPRFGKLVAAVEKVGHTTSVVTNSTDVTSQYVDYQSQITALEASRSQYLAIMAKATTINGILAVQAQLNSIEQQLQQLEGQRNVLVNQTAYGTLNVKLNGGRITRAPESSVNSAWHQSISGFVSGVDGFIRSLGPALFALLCLAALWLVWLVGRPLWRASRRRMI